MIRAGAIALEGLTIESTTLFALGRTGKGVRRPPTSHERKDLMPLPHIANHLMLSVVRKF